MDNIRGKTIAITGAARGIGYATAKALLARGARVVIGDRDVALQESAVAQLTKLGQVSGYPLDVTDRESFATFLDKARTDGGGHIDVLINNAGVMPIGPFLEQSEQAIRSAIEVNLYGVIAGCQLALPDMIARRSGHIINIASLSGMIPCPGRWSTPAPSSASSACPPAWPTSSLRTGVESAVSCRRSPTPISSPAPARQRPEPVSPRTSRRRSSRRWTSRRPMCRCRRGRRFIASVTPMLSARAAAAG